MKKTSYKGHNARRSYAHKLPRYICQNASDAARQSATLEYIRQFDRLNHLRAGFVYAMFEGTHRA